MSLEKRKIFFRADASAEIGYGHFIRTLALADMLKEDFDCTFFTQTPTAYQKDEVAKVCKLVELPATDEKFSLFLEYLSGDEIVVLDNYFFTTDYQRSIKLKGCKLVCIDDTHDKHYVADIVINHAIGFCESDFSVEDYTQLCLGLDWALLRKDFLTFHERNIVEAQDVFICFGGSDHRRLTPKYLLYALESIDNAKIHVVIGDGYTDNGELNNIYIQNQNRVIIHKALKSNDMVDVISKCKIGIVSASGILWETIFLGLPVLFGYYIDNQLDICNRNPRIGVSECLGNLSNVIGSEVKYLLRKLYKYQDYETLSISYNVKQNYLNLLSSNITIRHAKKKDCDLYFEWANDRQTRQMAFNKNIIKYVDHISWYNKKLEDNNAKMYLCYHKLNPIGQVRFDKHDNIAYIDISISPKFRGMHFSYNILKMATQLYRFEDPNVCIRAEVLVNNLASQKVFQGCGFKIRKINKEFIEYELHNCF